MATTSSKRLLQLAVPLVKQHGFTREALSLCVLSLPAPHKEPLSDAAVSTLFGQGENARRSLIAAWLDEAREKMKTWESVPTVKEVLKKRLECNEPVLSYLPEAFALLASPTSGIPPLDPRPGVRHAVTVADDACRITNSARGTSWYTHRVSLAAIYAAAELHQITSPKTAYHFLDTLLDTSNSLKSSLDETELFANHIVKGWAAMIKSRGIF